jgi:hypothetical protein
MANLPQRRSSQGRAHLISRQQVSDLTVNLRPQHHDASAFDQASAASSGIWLFVRDQDP